MPEANLFMERRAFPRVPVQLPVTYRVMEDMAGIQSVLEMRKNQIDTHTLDISLGGIYLVADQVFPIGAILRLEISISDKNKRLTAFGEVVWSKGTGAGLRFLMINNEDLTALKGFLDGTSPGK